MKPSTLRRSVRRSWGVAFAASFFSLLFSSPGVSACSCIPHPPPLEALAMSDAVFHGKVLEIDDSVELDVIARFAVSEVWKGPTESSIEVTTSKGGASCGVFFQVGSDYIVYASTADDDGAMWTNLCTRTRAYNHDEAEALGDPIWAPIVKADGFRRGDVDGSGEWDVTDVIASLSFQFLGTFEPSCMDSLDIDDSGAIDVSDPVAHLGHQFLGGEPPAAPFRECGEDPTEDALSCASYAPCDEEEVETLYHVFDNGRRCVLAPCFSWTLRSADDQLEVSDIDPSPLSLSPKEQEVLLEELSEGRRLVRGFLRDGPTGPGGEGKTLVIEDLPESAGEVYRVESSGIVCVTWPCPYFVARHEDDANDEGILFTDLDLRPLGLSERETAAIFDELQRGLWLVRGVFVRGPLGPAGLGTTLVVLELVERDGPPRIGPPVIGPPVIDPPEFPVR